MSHVAEVTLQVTDLDALSMACDTLGMELVRGQTTYRWFGRWLNDWSDSERAASLRGRDPKTFGHCEHAIRIKGNSSAYEIGVCPRLDGKPGYDLVYDAYGAGGGALHRVAGQDLRGLKDHYAAALSKRKMTKMGYRNITVVPTATGLKVRGYKS